MTHSPNDDSHHLLPSDWLRRVVISGSFAAILSALGYTAANIFLRAVSDSPAVVVSAVKASWTVLLFVPWLAWLAFHGVRVWPSPRTLGWLIVASVIAQFGGNWVFQWCLGVIGLAIAVPLTMGSMLISGGLLGRWLLGESVHRSTVIAIGIMIAAICLLSWGTAAAAESGPSLASGAASQEVATETSRMVFILGAIGGCIPGIAYAVLGIAIRKSTSEGIPLATPMVVVGLCGTVLLGGISLIQHGAAAITSESSPALVMMCLAGVANAIAFLALTRALKRIPVVFVNAINASQVAMAAVAGLLLFNERLTPMVSTGIGLTVIGFIVLNVAGIANSPKIRARMSRRRAQPFPHAAAGPEALSGAAQKNDQQG